MRAGTIDHVGAIQKAARVHLEHFERGARDSETGNGKLWVLTKSCPRRTSKPHGEDCPTAELVKAAHTDPDGADAMMPDDWRYEWIEEFLTLIDEAGSNCDPYELAENVEPEIYNWKLNKWHSSHAYRWSYTDAVEQERTSFPITNYGDSGGGIMGKITAGNWYERRFVFHSVVDFLSDEALNEDSA